MASPSTPAQENIHATSVAINGRGVLIMGRSGAGKSALAIQLIGMGAILVADDQTILSINDNTLWASSPTPIAGLIEARFVGLLKTPFLARAPVSLAIDLDQTERERMPQKRSFSHQGCSIPLLYRVDAAHFASIIRLYVLGGGVADR